MTAPTTLDEERSVMNRSIAARRDAATDPSPDRAAATPAEAATAEAATDQAATGEAGSVERMVMETRFGRLEFDPAMAIEMPRGLLGYTDHARFALAPLEDARFARFMALQSLSDPAVSFLVLPLGPEGGVIAPEDLAAAREMLGIAPPDLTVALIVAIRKIGGEVQISANLRAPIMFDAATRRGWQHVLPSNRYPVRFLLNPPEAAPEEGPA
jgi:flagellar assembly factor FliW